MTGTTGDHADSTASHSVRPEPTLRLRFLSHGTLESKHLERTRQFYERFMGFEVVRPGKVSLWVRLGGNHIYVCVQVNPVDKVKMPLLNHNGIDVETEADVDDCHALVLRDAGQWGLHEVTEPKVQHGTYSFFFYDLDDNAWEILANPPGGYTWMWDRGDQHGLGHLKASFERPPSTLARRGRNSRYRSARSRPDRCRRTPRAPHSRARPSTR